MTLTTPAQERYTRFSCPNPQCACFNRPGEGNRKRNRFMCYDLRNGKTLMPVVRDRGDAPRDTKHKPH